LAISLIRIHIEVNYIGLSLDWIFWKIVLVKVLGNND
jgi:hypothetical protein